MKTAAAEFRETSDMLRSLRSAKTPTKPEPAPEPNMPPELFDHCTLQLFLVIELLTFTSIVIGEDVVEEGMPAYSADDGDNNLLVGNVLDSLSVAYATLDRLSDRVFFSDRPPGWETELHHATGLLRMVVHHATLEGAYGNQFRVSRDCLSSVIDTLTEQLRHLRELIIKQNAQEA